jgi:flagellar protein FliT
MTMANLQLLLQISAKLYQHLTQIPKDDSREAYIETIHELLDERNELMTVLKNNNFIFNAEDKTHQMLLELDKGIRNRLENVQAVIQNDLKSLQNSKKNEKQYMNPYASVQVMDGRYYDKKK